MMLKSHVYVTNPATGLPEFLVAGSTAPDWAISQISHPDVLDQPSTPVAKAADSPAKDDKPAGNARGANSK